MIYTKGVWSVGRGGYCVVSTEPVPEVNGSDAEEYYGGHLIGESMSEANAKRIVECVSACDGMDNPADEIAKLRRDRNALLASSKDLMDFIMHPTIEADETIHELINMQKAIDLAGELWAR